ncbi:hypothetical protein J6590_070417 [Homalodisca vitripennis]|nr:hypothetical protein J6590_070417 [Homalodisca vitripennis]
MGSMFHCNPLSISEQNASNSTDRIHRREEKTNIFLDHYRASIHGRPSSRFGCEGVDCRQRSGLSEWPNRHISRQPLAAPTRGIMG